MRMTTVLIGATLLLGTACGGGGAVDDLWFDGDFEAAVAEASATDEVVMVDFYADWCGWCKRLEADTFADPEVRAQLEELVAIKADTDGDGSELAERYGVRSLPTVVFFDGEGREIERIVGFQPPRDFLRTLERVRG